jgi:hypothetical protein
MEKEKLKELIVEHKEKFLSKTGLIKREVKKKINTYLNSKEVILITGVRRSCKSSLMRLITEDIITKSKVPSSNIWIKNYEEVKDDKF